MLTRLFAVICACVLSVATAICFGASFLGAITFALPPHDPSLRMPTLLWFGGALFFGLNAGKLWAWLLDTVPGVPGFRGQPQEKLGERAANGSHR